MWPRAAVSREPVPWLTPDPPTWLHLLSARAAMEPTCEAFTFAPDGDAVLDRRDFAGLDRRARAIAVALTQAARPGARVLCLYRHRLEFIDALFGCFYAGMIAVPTFPPRGGRGGGHHGLRIDAIRKDCAPSAVLADGASVKAIAAITGDAIPILATDEGDGWDELAAAWRPPDVDDRTVCLLQYTSGSTADPRGVVLTHRQLLANSASIYAAFGHSMQSRGVLWLPHEHDMGLIGAVLQPIYACGPTMLMSPLNFIQEPLSWLRAIARHRATTSGGPNFAYEMCVERSSDEDLDGLDLSSWDVAFVGAELVRPATLDAFARRFAGAGFRRSSFLPCYGLAESTLIVTGTPAGRGPRTLCVSRLALERGRIELSTDGRALELVSCGVPVSCDVRIAVPDASRVLGDGIVGEILVRSASVAAGYWKREHDPAFGATLPEEDGAFLRTGDLGFLLDGELYVTGRLKDVIIVDGANHYAEDIEQSIEGCHADLRPGAGAVFGVDSGGSEGVVVVWETRRPRGAQERAALALAIRQAVTRAHEIPIADIVLTAPASVPRTGSGKVKRFECRQSYLKGAL